MARHLGIVGTPEVKPPIHHCQTGKCGLCLRCLTNARWERIYQAKIADPDYYSGARLTYASPLSSI